MAHFRMPTKAVSVPARIYMSRPPRERPGPSTADLALMRVVLGLPPGATVRIQTLGQP